MRLQSWDYRTPAWYFITICTHQRYHHFGEIRKGIMGLSAIGSVAAQNWLAIPDHYDHVALDAWIIMPNHVHGLIGIMDWPTSNPSPLETPVETSHGMSPQRGISKGKKRKFGQPVAGSISTIINQYKGSVTRMVRRQGHDDFAWQTLFYDHIVRNKKAFHRIRKYILNNPLKWNQDQLYNPKP
jgi:REP element-mobilizing transposase RayT